MAFILITSTFIKVDTTVIMLTAKLRHRPQAISITLYEASEYDRIKKGAQFEHLFHD
jgi:hypothetical protein